MPLVIKTICLHCLPARQDDRGQYSQSYPHYAAEYFLQLPSRAFQVLQQNMNPRSGERRSSDYPQYLGWYVLSFHVGLPRASSLALPTCRTAARKIDKRCTHLPLILLPTISGDSPRLAIPARRPVNFIVFFPGPHPPMLPCSCIALEPIRKTIFGACLPVSLTYIMRRNH